MDIGLKISKLRKVEKLSQPELAHELGISQTALCQIESGKTKKIDFLLMIKVCQFFNIDFDYFKEDLKFKQVNKDSSMGYNLSDKLVEQFENQIKEKIYKLLN